MSELVRVRLGDVEKSVGRAFAEAHDLTVLDEEARFSDGRVRPTTRKGGRPKKPKTTVAQAAAKKDKAAASTPEEAKE